MLRAAWLTARTRSAPVARRRSGDLMPPVLAGAGSLACELLEPELRLAGPPPGRRVPSSEGPAEVAPLRCRVEERGDGPGRRGDVPGSDGSGVVAERLSTLAGPQAGPCGSAVLGRLVHRDAVALGEHGGLGQHPVRLGGGVAGRVHLVG